MLKVLIKARMQAWLASFNAPRSSSSFGNKKAMDPKLRGGLIILLYVYVLGVFGFLSYTNFNLLASVYHAANLDWVYWAMAGLSIFSLVFITNIFMSASQLYQAKDTEMLLAMPVKPGDILTSRIFGLWLTSSIFEAVILIPAIICYLQVASLSILQVIALVIGMTVWPLASLALSCLFGYLLTLVTRRMKNKTLFSTVFSLLFIAIYFYAVYQMPNLIEQMVVSGADIGRKMSAVLPLLWLGKAIGESSMISLLWLTLSCMVVTFIIYQWLAHSFIKISLSMRNQVSYGRFKGGHQQAFSVKQAMLRKETGKLFSSSNYLLNSALGVVFLAAAGIYLLVKADQARIMMLELGAESYMVLICGLIVAGAILSMVTISSSSISLEGKSIWLLQSLPVSGFDILMSKAKVQFIVTAPFVLFAAIAASYSLRFSITGTILMILQPLAFAGLTALLGIIINLKHPRLDWINEVQVIKQSWSVGLSMIVDIVIVGVLAALYFVLLYRFMAPDIYLICCIVLEVAGIVAAIEWLKRGGTKCWARLG